MIELIEALNYRCLHYVSQRLGRIQVLVGPNASGKTTFLDVVAFLGDLVSKGLQEAVGARTQNFEDLLWRRQGDAFELAVELRIPEPLRGKLERPDYAVARYEVKVGKDRDSGEIGILHETLLLRADAQPEEPRQRPLFPSCPEPPESLATAKYAGGKKTVVNKTPGGNDNFYDETGAGWMPAFKLGPRKSALANLPEDETKFPVATWVKGLLSDGVQKLTLNSLAMRRPSPPGQPRAFLPDGSNLPWVVANLQDTERERYKGWVCHVRTALPDIEDIGTVLREEDKNRYIVLIYKDGLRVPSWAASDGTLRLLALTLPAYLPGLQGVFLIEEPENGIHPRALETVYQSLRSVYDAQVLVATHSPILVALADAGRVLCFAKTPDGATDIVRGTEHPKLRDWQRSTNLGDLFAAGVLG